MYSVHPLFTLFSKCAPVYIGLYRVCTVQAYMHVCIVFCFCFVQTEQLQCSQLLCSLTLSCLMYFAHIDLYSVSQKKSPLRTCGNFSKTLGNFSTKFYMPIMRSYLRQTTNFYSITCNFDEVARPPLVYTVTVLFMQILYLPLCAIVFFSSVYMTWYA